jgi:hypothetical protein
MSLIIRTNGKILKNKSECSGGIEKSNRTRWAKYKERYNRSTSIPMMMEKFL